MPGTWKQRLQRSLHLSRSKPEAKYFQLATVSAEGKPDSRTLVFRGFGESGDTLLAVTDMRSEKLGQLFMFPTMTGGLCKWSIPRKFSGIAPCH